MKIPNSAWVVIADAEKYLVLENHGDEELIDLRVREAKTHQLSATHEIGTDRPGRYPVSGGRRASVEDTDWKRQEKAELPGALAMMLSDAALADMFPMLVIAADPRTLGILRPKLHKAVLPRLIAEIAADYTHMTIPQIEDLLVGAAEPAH